MKKFLILALAFLAITAPSCTNEQPSGVSSPLAASVTPKQIVIPSNESLCFERVSGNNNQDTLRARLNFHGDQVTGSLDQLFFEKDARRGSVSGLLLGSEIKGYWTFMQEGLIDSLPVSLQLGNDALFWQEHPGTQEATRLPLMDCR